MFNSIKNFIDSRRLEDRATIAGIDGIDASGKTTFARSLAAYLEKQGRSVQLIHLDDFHNPLAVRRAQLPPPLAYYNKTFDYPRLIAELLQPAHRGIAVDKELLCLDLEQDEYCTRRSYKINTDSVLLLEGVFLFRPELVKYFDVKIHLYIDFKCCLKRVTTRDRYLFGTADSITARYKSKYIPGQILYYNEANPLAAADLVIDNTDFANPMPKKF